MTRKEQIQSTAVRLFRTRGYNAVSMRDIAQALDMKAASLYNHIGSKQEVLANAILEVALAFSEGMYAIDSDRNANSSSSTQALDAQQNGASQALSDRASAASDSTASVSTEQDPTIEGAAFTQVGLSNSSIQARSKNADAENSLRKAEQLIQLHIQVAEEFPDALVTLNNDWMHLTGDALAQEKSLRQEYERRFIRILETGIQAGAFIEGDPGIMLFGLLTPLRRLPDWMERRSAVDIEALKQQLPTQLINGIRAY